MLFSGASFSSTAALARPPEAAREASERYRLGRAIIGAGSLVFALLVVTAPWLSSEPWRAVTSNALLLAVHVAHLLWLRKGRPERAIKSFCFSYFLVITAMVAQFGGIRGALGYVYPPLVLAAGLMWSGRAGLGFAGLGSVAGLGFVWLEGAGLVSPSEHLPPPARVWALMTSALAVTAVLLHVGLSTLRRSQREALVLRERLGEAERLEALGRLAGGVAHDFNNQLTAVLGHLDLLRSLPPEEGERSIAAIEHAALHARELTFGLLEFGRRQSLVPVQLDAREIVHTVDRLLRPTLGKNVRFEVDLPAAPLWIRIDPVALERALVNVITNAGDALPNGGTIRLLAQQALSDAGDDEVAFEVHDDGVGMDSATRARIFEPFFTTKGRAKGTGLGLASVHGVVTQSGGHVHVRSQPGAGTCVRLVFRASGPPEAGPENKGRPAESRRPRTDPRILLVDDEPAVRRLMQRVLVGAGYDVTAASGVEEARRLWAARTQPFELLITDVLMPDGTGPELACRLQTECPRLLVLVISAYPAAELQPEQLGAPGRAFLRKPFAPSDLLRAVGHLSARLDAVGEAPDH